MGSGPLEIHHHHFFVPGGVPPSLEISVLFHVAMEILKTVHADSRSTEDIGAH